MPESINTSGTEPKKTWPRWLRRARMEALSCCVITVGIFMLLHFDPFYSKSSDPEFPYLINGLNCAQLNFNWIGHIDHPGTPFQVFKENK